MSGLLAAIGCGFLGLAIGAALQRWGNSQRAHGYQGDPLYREYAERWEGW